MLTMPKVRTKACRTLNGIGKREIESPILRSAVQETCFTLPSLFQPDALDRGLDAEPIFFAIRGIQLSMKRKREKEEILAANSR